MCLKWLTGATKTNLIFTDASRDPTSLSDNNSEIIATNNQTDNFASSKNLDERQENDISNVSDDIFHINLY
jgi:hypothetical protein